MTQTREQLESQNANFALAMMANGSSAEALRESLDMANATVRRLAAMVKARDAELEELRPKLEAAEKVIEELELRVVKPGTRLADIMAESAERYGVTVEDIIGPRRYRDISLARQEYFWRAWHTTRKSLAQIGRACGDRDHSTVSHGRDAHQDRIDAGEVAA